MAAIALLAVFNLLFWASQAQNFHGNARVTQASNRFNFFDIDLLKQFITQEGAHNFVVSPASIKAILAMLLEGADGNTASQIQKVLRLDGNSASHQTAINSFLQSLRVRYPGTIVEFANQIFLSPDTQVQRRYEEVLNGVYLCGIQNVEFRDRNGAAASINGWVSKNTHSLIRTLISPQAVDPQSRAMVVNALYFRGKWALPFDKSATTVRCFHRAPGMCDLANYMETVGQHGYANLKDLNAQALEISYQGSKFSMIFLVPNKNIEELLRDLPYQPLNTIVSKLESTTVVVSIPRFSIEYETDLTNTLSKLGVIDLFTPAANLSHMIQNGGNVFISKVFQKAVIEIDEEGTLGAAASGAVAVPLQGPTLPRFQAIRPFLFFVRDVETGNFLFEGLVEHPELADAPEKPSPLQPSTLNTGSLSNANYPQSNNPSVVRPATTFQNNPLNIKIDDTQASHKFPMQTGNIYPQNGEATSPNHMSTASNQQPASRPDNIHYPQ